ncbi:hypothetical protein [Celeribacter sp. PS-C1]|nr:hypothetical protein [Celeribacter sp. PS-C1]MBW6418410.1 hypothetical protein [Celeribacter sp. PS-C1]
MTRAIHIRDQVPSLGLSYPMITWSFAAPRLRAWRAVMRGQLSGARMM